MPACSRGVSSRTLDEQHVTRQLRVLSTPECMMCLIQPAGYKLMTGRTLLHYRILDNLGQGGMGVVYKALDTHLNRLIAIKVLPPEKVADLERKRRFVQEAKSASALNHPNIITIYDIASEDGVDFISMEYVPGKALDRLISRKGLPLNDVLKYAIQIADALAAAHAAGIIHRDLKPGNVMIRDEAGRPGGSRCSISA